MTIYLSFFFFFFFFIGVINVVDYALCLYNFIRSEKISNDQELIQSDPISCPQNQKGNN